MAIMSRFCICGDFYGKTITGIQRVGYEIVAELDKIVEKNLIEIAVPSDVTGVPEYENIQVVRIHPEKGNRHLWIQLWYARYIRKNRLMGITICNEVPVLRPGIAYLHDIYYKLYPEHFTGFGSKVSRAVVLMMYRAITKRAKAIMTVSENAKSEIVSNYSVEPNRVHVAYCGWQHVLRITEDDGIFTRFPKIEKGEYFFTLGSLAKRKNTQYIIQYAMKHPDEQFLLSGAVDDFFVGGIVPNNVVLLGYVSDGEMVSLMKNCKAFVLPTLYEGFGIPPLEALALGAKVLVSSRSCMPEIYQDTVGYFDPASLDVDLNALLQQETADASKALNRYSWEKSAETLRKVIYEQNNC